MEGPPLGVVGADFQFHRHRGIHLESKTYHTLLQVFNHCYGNSPLSSAPPILPPPSPSENNGGNRGLSDGDGGGETRLSEELDVSERREPEDSTGLEGTALEGGVKDAGRGGAIDSTQMMIDELEQIMQTEDNGNGSIVDNETEGTGIREMDINREQILMNELQDVMEGSEEWFNDGGARSNLAVLEDAQDNDGVSGLLNEGEQFADLQRIAEDESRGTGQAQSEKEGRLEAAETVVSSSEIGGLLNKGEQFSDLQRIAEEESGGTGQAQSEKESRLEAAETVVSPVEIGGLLNRGELFADLQRIPEEKSGGTGQVQSEKEGRLEAAEAVVSSSEIGGLLNKGEQFSDLQRIAEEESGSTGQAQSEKESRLEAAETVVSPVEIGGLLSKGEQFADLQRIPEEESGGTGQAQSEKEGRLEAAETVVPSSEIGGLLNKGEQISNLQRIAEEESGGTGQAQSEKECGLEAAETVVSPVEIGGLLNKGEQFADLQRIPEEESGGTVRAQSEKEECRLEAAETVISPSEIGGIDEVLKPSGNSEQGSSTQHKETGSEQPASSHHNVPSIGEMVESHDLEEGEISGDDSGDMVLDDAIFSQQSNADQRQLSNDLTDKNECTPNEEDGSKRSMESPAIHVVHCASRSKKIEFEESNLNKMVDEDKEVPRKIGSGSYESPSNLDQTGNNMKEVASREKDDNLCKKRKRGPGKEKKRAKERKKRAKIRRELGLDRVKVKPILKPKTVSYCRHYLAGRCQEGEKCKFSHDTVPLTKSTPCRYFSRNACMKGDDCPFDHQLSKYPCDNYTNKGFCSRGDSCLFSHQLPREEGAPSFLQPEKSDPKSPMPSSVNTKQQHNVFETPQKMVSREQSTEPVSKEPSSSRSSMIDASRTGQRNLPPRRTQSRATGDLTNEGALDATKNIQSSNGSVVSKTVAAPVAAPAGINFLSFSKGSSAVSSGKSLASLILSGGDASKQLPNGNGNGSQAMHSSATSRDQNLTQMRKESPLAVPPRGLSFLSFGKDLADDSVRRGQAGTPSSEKDGHLPDSQHASDQQHKPSPIMGRLNATSVGPCRLSGQLLHRSATSSTLDSSCLVDRGLEKNRSAQESQHAPDKQFMSKIPWKLPVNPSATGQSSVQSTQKTVSSLRQNTVMSTLSWASNFNSKPASLPAVGSGVGGGGESSTAVENNSVKVSKILDFLSSIGGKTKH